MVSIREWVAFGMGLTTGGLSLWAFARGTRPGQIFWIGDNVLAEYKDAAGETAGTGMYVVQASVVKAVAARAARVVKKGSSIDMLLIGIHRRGVLTFMKTERTRDNHPKYGELYEVLMLPTEQARPEWGLKAGESTPTIRDVLVELAAYGLARPGLAFRSHAAFMRGQASASGPLNLQVVRDAPREVEVEVERQRPGGSYFKIGESYYADGHFLERMEWIPGSEYDEETRTTTVPLWKRGKLLFKEMGKARTLPEQQGGLYLLKGELTGVDLEDVLTELVELGLVGWGGEWAKMPELNTYAPTGTPKWNPAGKVRSYEGQEFVDEATVKQMLTRLESARSPDGTIQIAWRGRSVRLRPAVATTPARQNDPTHRIDVKPGMIPRLVSAAGTIPGMEGKVYVLGASSDLDVMALVDELILRRLAYRVKDAAPRASRPDLPVGHIYVGGEETFVDEPFAEAMRARAEGMSFNTNDLSIHLRFGLNGDVFLHPWDMRLGVAPIMQGQVGGAYVLEFKGPYGTKPDEQFLAQLTNHIVKTGQGKRVPAAPPYPIDAPSNPLLPTGHLYGGDPPILDGRLAGLLSAQAQRVIVVDFGIDLDMGEAGMIGLRLLSRKVGPLNLLPEQVGAAFEVDLSRLSPQKPLLFRDLVTSLVEKGEAKRLELRPGNVSVEYEAPKAGQP